MPSRDPEATATEFADRFTAKDAATATEAAALLSETGREAVLDAFSAGLQFGELDAEDALEEFRYGLYGQYGESAGVGDVTTDGAEVSVELAFADGSQRLDLRVADGEVADFALPSEYEPPAYAEADAFTERGVTVDAGDVALDGTLAVPDGDGPFAGVVLVHGAGIHDPDGTAGESKLLQDFAWGLATEGIAALRYEKRLHDHDVAPEEHTLDTVVVDDAVAALDELASADTVDEDALFVAGHSQGGLAAPRIADRHGGVAGVVSLDGPSGTEPDPDDVRPLRYFLEPDGDLDEDQEALLAQQQETAQRLVDRDYEPDEVLRDKPGRWWDSVLDYDPGALAESIDAPVFALKTGRADPEAQPELVEMHRELLADWRDLDLGEAGRVAFYDGLGHYFQTGHEPSTMTHLQFADNVAEHAVRDVAEWVRGVADT
ncbi:alpha/beta hydrolase family protein [Halobacterium sp. MBLA0001]|uniref:alpha/beta hydrolase family protein n=1 Tax=Halobacterium sp. MBLA0001 TaxID=3413511 RepID=UPI003C7122F4